MATTTRLGMTKLEVGQASKEATINANLDILDAAVPGNASGAIWARVFHSTTQSIADNTVVTLAFNSERWDTNVIHDNSTNNSRLTCKTAGVYLISVLMEFAFNATGVRQAGLIVNATTTIGLIMVNAVGGVVPTRLAVSTVYPMAVNDYVQATAFQTSGGALNVASGASFTPEFMMIRLGA